MKGGKLQFVKLTDIQFGNRVREDLGDIEELAESIKEKGLISPIAVQSDNGLPPYLLAAGGRRFIAVASLGEEEIACRVYDHPLSELEIKTLERVENIERKNLTYDEECKSLRDINNLQVEIYGKKIGRSPDAEGHSMRDTAKMLNRSPSSVSEDIKLAEAMDSMPDLELDKCKNKKEAFKKLEKVEESLIRRELAKRADKLLNDGDRKLADAYVVGDFFEKVKQVPDGVFDLVEVDPPYAIKLQHQKKLSTDYATQYGDTYNEVSEDLYKGFVTQLLTQCYRIMNDHSWLIFWFGPEPWFEFIYSAITDAGFVSRRMPAIWKKATDPGQTQQPSMYLGSSYEMFFYARKGDANIAKSGRSNIFDFKPVPPSDKSHPTEKPIELMQEILTTFTWESSRIIVPFAGSGNTLLAAHEEKMFPLGFDLGKEYKDSYVAKIAMKGGE
jgi:ParB/RepB/Spo0J family partition protein